MTTPNDGGYISPLITSTELSARLQSEAAPRMIDVREVGEFAAGHIPGAELMPLSEFANLYRSLPSDQELILVCRSGNRSGMAQRFLMGQGYQKTRNLVDGMLGWQGHVVQGM